MPACMTRSQTHQENRQICWCAGAWWYKTPSPTSLRLWTRFSRRSGSCLLKSTCLSPHQRIYLGGVWDILSISEICLYRISQDNEQNPFVVYTWTEEPSLPPNLTSTPAQAGTGIGLGTCYSSSFFKDF